VILRGQIIFSISSSSKKLRWRGQNFIDEKRIQVRGQKEITLYGNWR
jgi:hypothetical protein